TPSRGTMLLQFASGKGQSKTTMSRSDTPRRSSSRRNCSAAWFLSGCDSLMCTPECRAYTRSGASSTCPCTGRCCASAKATIHALMGGVLLELIIGRRRRLLVELGDVHGLVLLVQRRIALEALRLGAVVDLAPITVFLELCGRLFA